MRCITALIILLITAFATNAQTLGDYEEVVYLKNGSVIRGIIIEEKPGISVKIQTHERNELVYSMSEVERITRELPQSRSGGRHGDTRKSKGFEMFIDNGLNLTFQGGDPYPMYGLMVSPGYRVNHLFFVGGSTGVIVRSGFVAVPVMADMRLTLTRTKVAPIMRFNLGYLSPSFVDDSNVGYGTTSNYGGFALGAAPGLSINLKKNVDLNFFTGYFLGSQIISFDTYYSDGTDVNLMHFLTIHAGVKF